MKDIPNYEGLYSVTKDGRVWGGKRRRRTLKSRVNWKGYETVDFDGGTKRVHRLVALTYIPNPENKSQVNHIDGNKLNNHVDNLEWCTPKENSAHYYGGERNVKDGRPKLDWEKVAEIRRLHKEGLSQLKLAAKFNVSHRTIGNVIHNRTWRTNA